MKNELEEDNGMGLVMNTGSVKNQLELMNAQFDDTERNALEFQANIMKFGSTRLVLNGEAYTQSRKNYNKVHMSLLRGIIAYVEALHVQNNTYSIYIENFLSGIGYVDEDELKRDKKSLEQQISNVKNAMLYQKGCYSDYLGCLERTLELVKRKLEKIGDFKSACSNLYSGLDGYVNNIKKGIECIENSTFNSNTGEYTLGQSDMLWLEELKEKCNDRTKIQFYDNLPENLKLYLSIEDFECTDDGFFMCTQSLEDIFLKTGLDKVDVINCNNDKVQDFDDWYLSSIIDGNGNATYTFIKVRELGDDTEPGTSVPFIAMDIENFVKVLASSDLNNGYLSDKDKEVLSNITDDIIYGKGEVSTSLLEYFKNPASNGSYLIADILIEKTIESNVFDENGNYILQHKYNDNVSQARVRLDELEKTGVYNKDMNSIHINDLNNLSKDEKDAIIVTTTGNPNVYSYAAENQYHADMYGSNWGMFDEMAIKSDAGVVESKNARWYEHNFKNEDGKYYMEQMENH